jgi:hypothetical protein
MAVLRVPGWRTFAYSTAGPIACRHSRTCIAGGRDEVLTPEADVKCIEHGQQLDEPTLAMTAEKGVSLAAQKLVEDTPNMDPVRREKRKAVVAGAALQMPLPLRRSTGS